MIDYETDQTLFTDLKQSVVPFTYRFLGLRLRLAFTKRKFRRVEATYQQHLNTSDHHDNNNEHQHPNDLNDLVRLVEDSFSTLRDEIDRIEEGQEYITRRALPRVREKICLHRSFLVFLSGFRPTKAAPSTGMGACAIAELDKGDEELSCSSTVSESSSTGTSTIMDEDKDAIVASSTFAPATTTAAAVATPSSTSGGACYGCLLPMLNIGEETTTGIKQLIAEFAGVPTGMLLHDMRSLETLLTQSEHERCSLVLVQLDTTATPATASSRPS